MAGLFSLPNELISHIYTFATPRTKARLSAVNHLLRKIWLQDADPIIRRWLQLVAPMHSDAIVLTLLESSYPMPRGISGFHTLDGTREASLLRLLLPQLMHNIKLANSICRDILLMLDHPLAVQLPPLYYLARQLVVAYHYPELRASLYTVLQALSEDSLSSYARVTNQVTSLMRDNEFRQIHDTVKPNEEYLFMEHEYDRYGLKLLANRWEFASAVVCKLNKDRENGVPENPGGWWHPDGGPIMRPPPWSDEGVSPDEELVSDE